MSPETNAREESGTEAGADLRLRDDQLTLMTKALGCDTDLARAELLHLDPKTLRRARAGNFGTRVIAQILSELGEREEQLAAYGLTPKFENLFAVEQQVAA